MIVHIEPYQASIDAIQAQLDRLGYRNAMEGIHIISEQWK